MSQQYDRLERRLIHATTNIYFALRAWGLDAATISRLIVEETEKRVPNINRGDHGDDDAGEKWDGPDGGHAARGA